MGRTIVFGTFMAAVLLIAAAARSDVAQQAPADQPDPDPRIPISIGQTDPGPASALWHYSDLSPGEQAWVDRNADTTGWDHIGNAYAQAAKERGQAAAALDAATQLGLDDLANEGVAP